VLFFKSDAKVVIFFNYANGKKKILRKAAPKSIFYT